MFWGFERTNITRDNACLFQIRERRRKSSLNNSIEFKYDVYGRRQTAKITFYFFPSGHGNEFCNLIGS